MFGYARARVCAGFRLVQAASTRRDEYFGGEGEGLTREIVFSPERLAEAEARKEAARDAERAKAGRMRPCT
jgi:hypothetical protein